MENTGSLRIDDMPDEAEAHLLSLDGQWISACASKRGGGIWLSNIRGGSIEGGMSGSPIVIGDAAVGVVCVGGGATGEPQTEGGPNRGSTAICRSDYSRSFAAKKNNKV